MGAFAEFERNIISERQTDGIAKAKARGVYANRECKPSINHDEVKRLSKDGMTPTRRRVRMSKYIILVKTVGAVVGAKLSYIYFIDI